MNPEQEARLKAEARAYALSSSTSSKTSKRKLPATLSMSRPQPQHPHHATAHLTTAANYGPLTSYRSIPTLPSAPNASATSNSSSRLPIPLSGVGDATVTATHPILGALDENDDDYMKFVKSLGLGLDDSIFGSLDNDDEEEFHLSDIEEEDDFDEDEDDDLIQRNGDVSKNLISNESTPGLSSPLVSSPISLPDLDTDVYKSLEEELGSLLEEDLEAAVQSLMTCKKPMPSSPSSAPRTSVSPKNPKSAGSKKGEKTSNSPKTVSPATPLRESARQGNKAQISYKQSQQLRRLLMGHYQLLVQQAVLAVRAAHIQKLNREKSDFLSGETADDLAEILDGAVGMLQDLDENRKDAIRNSIQLMPRMGGSTKGRRSLLNKFEDDLVDKSGESNVREGDRRLTRAAFTKTLEKSHTIGGKRTAFDIPGLIKLKETFLSIDKSVEGIKGEGNILESDTHTEACKMILRQASSHVDETSLPSVLDLSENFCEPTEIFGPDFEAPCSEEQNMYLRRNRNLFTSGEDNLVLRGVNLYGEKQWILIADRYLPDRSINIISQRYSKLCVMMYKAHGIHIDDKGNLEKPPKLESVDDIDEERVKELELTAAEPPAILNVHRWALEEDLTLLKAVPIMGHMWAELGARLIPHRDRGHLRKRYQVLDRRVKATVARSSKTQMAGMKISKQSNAGKSNMLGTKSTHQARAVAKDPPMTIEKAAASLAFLRPPAPKPAGIAPPTNIVRSPDIMPPPTKPLVTTTLKSKKAAKPALDGHSDRPHREEPVAESKADWQLHDSTSRAAYEKLVEGANEEWSQLTRMKQMLENDAESQAADGLVSHLAKSPGPKVAMSRLAQIEMDNISGLSVFEVEGSKLATRESNEKGYSDPTESSIMSRVLGNSKRDASSLHEQEKECDSRHKLETLTIPKSPKKRPFRDISGSNGPAHPVTPKRKTNFFSTAGSPTGLSPWSRAPGLTLTPNPMYSPPPQSVMRLMSEPSGDEIRFCDFQISEDSRKGLEEPLEPVHDANPPPFASPAKNSLMMEEYDAIEAISALNSLSNSPFRPPPAPEKSSDGKGRGRKKSFFASVVGGMKEKDPKTKLQF